MDLPHFQNKRFIHTHTHTHIYICIYMYFPLFIPKTQNILIYPKYSHTKRHTILDQQIQLKQQPRRAKQSLERNRVVKIELLVLCL